MNNKKPFMSYVDMDSVTVICPCGARITGEGDCVSNFKKLHLHHTTGETKETITADGRRAVWVPNQDQIIQDKAKA